MHTLGSIGLWSNPANVLYRQGLRSTTEEDPVGAIPPISLRIELGGWLWGSIQGPLSGMDPKPPADEKTLIQVELLDRAAMVRVYTT